MKICGRCNKPLTLFSGYIPCIGELCKRCYDEALMDTVNVEARKINEHD